MSTNTTLEDVVRELAALDEPKMREANERWRRSRREPNPASQRVGRLGSSSPVRQPVPACDVRLHLDAILAKIRDEGFVRNVSIALAILPGSTLGIWIEQSEDSKFWLRVMNEMKSRDVEDRRDIPSHEEGRRPE